MSGNKETLPHLIPNLFSTFLAIPIRSLTVDLRLLLVLDLHSTNLAAPVFAFQSLIKYPR